MITSPGRSPVPRARPVPRGNAYLCHPDHMRGGSGLDVRRSIRAKGADKWQRLCHLRWFWCGHSSSNRHCDFYDNWIITIRCSVHGVCFCILVFVSGQSSMRCRRSCWWFNFNWQKARRRAVENDKETNFRMWAKCRWHFYSIDNYFQIIISEKRHFINYCYNKWQRIIFPVRPLFSLNFYCLDITRKFLQTYVFPINNDVVKSSSLCLLIAMTINHKSTFLPSSSNN